MEGFTLRPAGPDDVEAALGLIRDLASFEKMPEAVKCSKKDLNEALFSTPPSLHAVLAFAGEQPVGLATYYFTFSSFRGRKILYLEDIYVADEARGAGLGRLLMAHVAACAQAAGCAGMRWLVLDWNDRAIGFYESLGASRDAQWFPYGLTGEAFLALAQCRKTAPKTQ